MTIRIRIFVSIVTALLAAPMINAQVLPEDRADALYHSYDGGGVEITGPSILFRKKLGSNFSGYANYYVDSISSASVDVETYASPYSEERTEISVGGDYLLGETILSAGYTDSDENDFEAKTAYFNVSQEVFGGLTTVNMGYARGWDKVYQVINGQPSLGIPDDLDFKGDVDRRAYRLGLSQVLTKNYIMTFNLEVITDEGFLNNPYRQVRYLTDTDSVAWQDEVYPNTRTSTAVATGGRYFLNSGSAIYGNGRVFSDTWGIDAWNAQLGYTHRLNGNWLLDISYRYYTQTAADFYNDLFPFEDSQNFLARDKELSTFQNHSVSFGATYELPVDGLSIVDRGTINFNYSFIQFNYDDFNDASGGVALDEESAYDFDAGIYELFISFWF